MLASALHKFGWVFGGSVTSQKFGRLRHGKRVTIQATAAGRHRKGVKRGKAPVVSGRPAGSQSVNIADKHCMPVHNEPKGSLTRFKVHGSYSICGLRISLVPRPHLTLLAGN